MTEERWVTWGNKSSVWINGHLITGHKSPMLEALNYGVSRDYSLLIPNLAVSAPPTVRGDVGPTLW